MVHREVSCKSCRICVAPLILATAMPFGMIDTWHECPNCDWQKENNED